MYYLLAAFIGALFCFLCLIPILRKRSIYNKEIEEKNLQLKQECKDLQTQRGILQESISHIKIISEQSAKEYKELCMKNVNENISNELDQIEQNYQKAIERYNDDFDQIQKEVVEEYRTEIDSLNLQVVEVSLELSNMREMRAAAVEAYKREEEIKNKQSFYKLQLSQEDTNEIQKLREVAQYLRDSEPLNKVIWKAYYEKPYTDLIGRVVGSKIVTGIYKITNISNQMCYVGQAVNISDRWKQHIKRGIGADTPTRNKLYPAMLETGVENFTFEIVEECSKALLNEKEDYWQDYFKAKEFGYSIK